MDCFSHLIIYSNNLEKNVRILVFTKHILSSTTVFNINKIRTVS